MDNVIKACWDLSFYRKEKEEAGSRERKGQTETDQDREAKRQREFECKHAVIVTTMGSSFVAFLGLATVPTVIVMSVYSFAFDKKLKKKGFACLA